MPRAHITIVICLSKTNAAASRVSKLITKALTRCFRTNRRLMTRPRCPRRRDHHHKCYQNIMCDPSSGTIAHQIRRASIGFMLIQSGTSKITLPRIHYGISSDWSEASGGELLAVLMFFLACRSLGLGQDPRPSVGTYQSLKSDHFSRAT